MYIKKITHLIKLHYYVVTIATIKFLWPELTGQSKSGLGMRLIQEELTDTSFVDFDNRLVPALSKYNKTYKSTYISYGNQ